MKYKGSIFESKLKAIRLQYLVCMIVSLIGFQMHSQVVRVIDNKGTISEVNNNQVTTATTAPISPLENDIWIDTTTNTVKVWEGTPLNAWQEMASIRNWISDTNSGSYAVDHLVSYKGNIYKNLTGVNTDTDPSADTLNWNGTNPIVDLSDYEFIKEGNLIRGVGLEAISGGTIESPTGNPLINYELAFDGDPNTFTVGNNASFSDDKYVLPSALNVRKIKIDYSGRPTDTAYPDFYLWNALDVELVAIDAPTLTANERRTISYETNAQNTAKVRTRDDSGSRVNIYEISLYTIEASTEIPTISVGDTVFIEGCGYATVLTNVDGNITLETTSHNAVPLWVNTTNGGSYISNDIINYNGVLYKNLTGTNLDTSPNVDTTNWASTASLFQSDGVNSIDLAVQSDGSARTADTEVVITDNGRLGVGTTSPSHKADFHGSTGGANIVVVGVGDVEGSTNPLFYLQAGAGEAVIQSRRNHPLVLKVNNIQRLKLNTDDSAEFRGNIHTKDFSTEWLSDADGGSYAIDYIVIHNGIFYKNLTGTNLDTTPNLDTTNWTEVVPDFEVVPLWKSDTNGGSYATNDIINYNGVLYKNLTGTNLDTTPELDSTNWAAFESDTIDSVPLWSSATNGGSYDIDDIINYNGVLYKNNTGTNTDVTPNTDLTDWEVLDASISHSTGVQLGGVLSVGSPNTTFSISDGFGYIIDNMTDPFNPEAERINWSGLTNIAATNIATQLITFISIDQNGAVIQQASRWSNSERRDRIIIGVIVHVDNISIDVVNNEQQVGQDAVSQIYDILNGLGFINVEGNVFGANGSNLLINKTAGTMLGSGINYANNINNPHQLILPGLTQANFQYRLQNGTNLTGLTNQTIDPDIYDVGGVATSVPAKKYTIQHIYSFTSNNVKIQPGQGFYNKIDEAIVAINSDAFVTEQSIKENGLLRGYLIIKEGTNDLTDAKKVRFIEASNIPGSKGGSSGASVLLSAVPLWKSSSNGGSYLLNDIINYNGVLYKNLTSDNLDTTPDLDTTNWVALASTSLSDTDGDTSVEVERTTDNDTVYIKTNGVDRLTTDASGTTSRGKIKINNGQFASINHLDIGFNGTTGIASFESIGNGNTSMDLYTSNGGTQNLGLRIDKDQNVIIPQDLTTDTFSTAWVNNTNGGVYVVNDLVIYLGGIYKNLTGNNTNTTPNADTTNWSAIVGGSSVNVVNSLNSTSTVDALSAAQGKNLQDNKLNTNSVINSATSTSTTSPVSAAQVRLLDIGKLDKVDVTGTEQFMGYQINGRDVYQKYVSGTSPTGFTNLYLEFNGVNTLLSVEGVIKRNGQSQWHLISQMGNDRDGHAGAVYQENDDIAMYGGALLGDFQGQSFKIVLKYTK